MTSILNESKSILQDDKNQSDQKQVNQKAKVVDDESGLTRVNKHWEVVAKFSGVESQIFRV